jgi:hypothetical protein
VQSPAQKKNDVTPEVSTRSSVTEGTLPASSVPVPAAPRVEPAPVASVAAPAVTAAPVVAPVQDFTADDEDDDLPRPGKVWDSGGPSLVELLKQRQQQEAAAAGESSAAEAPAAPGAAAEVGATVSNVEPAGLHDLPTIWKDLLADLSKRGPVLPSLLMHGRLAAGERRQRDHPLRAGARDVPEDARPQRQA